MQNFKKMPGGVHGSNGEVLGVGAKPGCFARGMVGLDRPRNGSMPNLATVKRVPRTRLVPGTVVWAHVPYEDRTGEKTRPAVVVERKGRDLTILPGTTSDRRWDLPGKYVEVRDRPAAGLTRPTGIRTTSVTVDLIEVVGVVGQLGESDTKSILGLNPPGCDCTSADRQIARRTESGFASMISSSGDAA